MPGRRPPAGTRAGDEDGHAHGPSVLVTALSTVSRTPPSSRSHGQRPPTLVYTGLNRQYADEDSGRSMLPAVPGSHKVSDAECRRGTNSDDDAFARCHFHM